MVKPTVKKKTAKTKRKVKRASLDTDQGKREYVRKLIKQLDAVDAVGILAGHIAQLELDIRDPQTADERGIPTDPEQLMVHRGAQFRRLKHLCRVHGLDLGHLLLGKNASYSFDEEAVDNVIRTYEDICASLGVKLRKLPEGAKWYRFAF